MSFDKDSWDAAVGGEDRDAEIARLRVEVERLKAALEPFASLTIGGEAADAWASKFPRFYQLVSNARAALAAQPAPRRETDWGPDMGKEILPPAPSPWRPIETAQQTGMGPWMLLGNSERKWVRMGWYYAACRKWYYSGTTERTQYSEAEGGTPTHWMPLPPAPKKEVE